MELIEFELVLDKAVEILTENLKSSSLYHGPEEFEQGVLDMLKVAVRGSGLAAEPTFHNHAFPDIRVNGFGVEVKYTKRDTWLSVGNSIFEGMRDPDVGVIYVIMGKTGGTPEARWGRYEECVTHVRVSNSPRFVVELDGDRAPLFEHFDISYDDFAKLNDDAKMMHVREYSRKRLKEGDRLWWLEQSHAIPVHVRPYMRLSQAKKRILRAEAAILCPQVCGGSRQRNKYTDAALYLLMHHGVFCPQARDLFSAGSVAGPDRGGNYLARALLDIEDLMRDAAKRLDDALIEEYWGISFAHGDRIAEWLKRADSHAKNWVPSETLFLAN